MSYVTYTTKRHLEKTAFSASGTDISASSTDDSFNSVTTSLSGVSDNEWVYVTGFTTAANNGWFQAAGASTATKIIEDSSSLTTETAGNTINIQGYARGINQSYKLVFDSQRIDTPGEVESKTAESLSGVTETIHHHEKERFLVTTTPFHNSERKQFEEFWWSVSRGEQFTLDVYGTSTTDDDPRSVRMVDKKMNITREGQSQYFTFSFEAVAV